MSVPYSGGTPAPDRHLAPNYETWHGQVLSTEIVNASTGQVLSRHRTRQGAVDTWRVQFSGVAVQVWRRSVPQGETLIVEGTWHESHRTG